MVVTPSIQNDFESTYVNVNVLFALAEKVEGIDVGYTLLKVLLDSIAEAACSKSLLSDEVALDVRHAPYERTTIPAKIAMIDITTMSSTIVKAERELFFILFNIDRPVLIV